MHMRTCRRVGLGACVRACAFFFFFFSTEGSPQPGSGADRKRSGPCKGPNEVRFKRMHRRCILTHCFFSFSWRTLRFAPRLVNRTRRVRIHAPFGCMYNMCTFGAHVYTRACTRGHRRCAHAWRTLRSHDFDTITCVRRCERAVMFFVTSLCFGRYASGAWISCTLRVHTCTCMCAHVCTLSGTHMCERVHVHVSAHLQVCVISFSHPPGA